MVVIGTVLGVGLSVGGGLVDTRQQSQPTEPGMEQARLLAEVMERVKRDYVEPIGDAELMEKAIRGMVSDLDSHSAFLDPGEYEDIRMSTTGRYAGVGLEVTESNERIVVIAPIDGTPAQRAGVEPGDEIIEIDGLAVEEAGLSKAVGYLRGVEGTPVELRVRRQDYDDPLTFHLTRQNIQLATVHHQLLDRSVGYLRLSQFIETTADEVSRAIDQMMEAAQRDTGNMLTGLILDLRNNPGGMLTSAVDVSDLFLNEGIIVSAEGRAPESRFVKKARRGDVLDGAAIVVLVNKGSASAAEIVAGALQDHDRATLVGTRTFGKGLVQTVMPLSKGRAIKLTTSHYFTPSGDSIDGVGVTPDVLVESLAGYANTGPGGAPDREHDLQLQRALQLLRREPILHSMAPD